MGAPLRSAAARAGVAVVAACAVAVLVSCTPVERRDPFPKQDGWVTDAAGVIPAAAEERIEADLQSYQSRSQGKEVAVVVIRSLGNRSVEDYAEDLFGEWGIGAKEQDSGVLLLIARDDRKMRIETGYGAGAELTDVESNDILEQQVRPRLRANNFTGAVDAGQRAIRAALGDEQADVAAPPPITQPGGTGRQAPRRTGGGISLLFFLLPLIFFFLSASSGRRRRRRRGGYYGGGGFGFPIFIGGGGWGGGGYGGGSGGFGGSSGGLGGGGFGGFGGGDSGGGGASGDW